MPALLGDQALLLFCNTKVFEYDRCTHPVRRDAHSPLKVRLGNDSVDTMAVDDHDSGRRHHTMTVDDVITYRTRSGKLARRHKGKEQADTVPVDEPASGATP